MIAAEAAKKLEKKNNDCHVMANSTAQHVPAVRVCNILHVRSSENLFPFPLRTYASVPSSGRVFQAPHTAQNGEQCAGVFLIRFFFHEVRRAGAVIWQSNINALSGKSILLLRERVTGRENDCKRRVNFLRLFFLPLWVARCRCKSRESNYCGMQEQACALGE